MEKFYPAKTLTGWLGQINRIWEKLFVSRIVLPEISAPDGNPDADTGWLYVKDSAGTSALYFEDDSGTVTQIATTPTAWDDIGDPDAPGEIKFSTHAQAISAAKTDGDMLTISGIGNFGDVSVVRIESKTGNPTDGTILEVVSHDVNVDPLVISAKDKANALVVKQDGDIAIANNATVGGTLGVTGVITCPAGAVLGTDLVITATTNLTSAQVKALKATPIALTPAPGADKFIQFLGATLTLDYGSNAFTESSDNLVIEYETSGVDASAAIETTGFIDQTTDTICVVTPAAIAGAAATSFNGKKLVLTNTGDGEIAGNAANDSQLTVSVTYVVRSLGLV